MTIRIPLRTLAVCVALLPLAAPRSSAAQDVAPAVKAEARERFDRGLKLFNDGDNAAALAEFHRAYELIPNATVLYNIGLVYAAMSRPVEAVDALDRAAESGKLSAERLARAKQVREEQSQRVAEVEVTTNVPATIELDTVEIGKTPLSAPIRIASGTRVIGAVAEGYAPARKEITVAGRTRTQLKLDLVALGAPAPAGAGIGTPPATRTLAAPAPATPASAAGTSLGGTSDFGPVAPEHDGSRRPQRTWGWVTVAVGGALIVGGGTYFLVNAAKKRDAETAFDSASSTVKEQTGVCHAAGASYDRSACEAQYNGAWDDLSAAKNRSAAGLVVTGVGAAAAALGVYLLVAAPTVRVTPTVGLRSVGLSGSF